MATATEAQAARERRTDPLTTPTDLKLAATRDISAALNLILADVFALYVKTKNFHWHMSGTHFRDYHLLLDEQADQIYAISDTIAERVRKVGGTTLCSIKHVSALQRIEDNDADYVTPLDMLAELRDDNERLAGFMRAAHGVCDERRDVATASLLEVWIDEAERRAWFLFEAGLSASSLQTSSRLAVATSRRSSQTECVSRICEMSRRLSSRSSASMSCGETNSASLSFTRCR